MRVTTAAALSLDERDARVALIEKRMDEILTILGVPRDDSTERTAFRVAKMYVHELFYGLSAENYPKITAQANSFGYDEMLIEVGITVHSVCEHHLVPIIGVAHVAYIPKEKVLGLSKFNRVVDYFSRRPQVQEKLTMQVATDLKRIVETDDVAVVIDAAHMCVRLRGIKDRNAVTRTSALFGKFRDGPARDEFFRSIPSTADFRL